MDRSVTYIILIINIVVAIIYFIKRNNEVPFFLALFNLMVEYRVIALENGTSSFIAYDYGIDFKFNMEYAYIASNLILLGTCVMLYSYILFYKPKKNVIKDSNALLRTFVEKKKTQIIIGLCFFSLISVALSGSDTGSYSFLTKLGNASFIIMLFMVMFFSDKKSLGLKLLYGAVFLFMARITYSTAIRFQFLSWIIPICYFLVRNVKPVRKVIFSIAGIFLIMIVFSLAGVMRNRDLSGLSVGQIYDLGLNRLQVADDINFIDGFIMLYQVYPKLLDYDYGLEHIEILLRPIPRSLWPGKPQASWVRKYQEKYNGEVLQSAGFSPTIWGVFYSEFGEAGIVILSVAWAWFLGYLYSLFKAFNSDLSFLLVGILLTCLIPVFRSGDMAGDFAIVLMSFWPMIVFVRQYKKFVKKQLRLESYKKLAVK